jgi:hypothetical protein
MEATAGEVAVVRGVAAVPFTPLLAASRHRVGRDHLVVITYREADGWV